MMVRIMEFIKTCPETKDAQPLEINLGVDQLGRNLKYHTGDGTGNSGRFNRYHRAGRLR